MLHCRIVQNTSFYEKQIGKIWLLYFTQQVWKTNLAQNTILKNLSSYCIHKHLHIWSFLVLMIHINEVKMRCITHLIVHISILSRVSFFLSPLVWRYVLCLLLWDGYGKVHASRTVQYVNQISTTHQRS